MRLYLLWRSVLVVLATIVASVLAFGVSLAQASGMAPYPVPKPLPGPDGSASTVALVALVALVVVGFIVYLYFFLRPERRAATAAQIRPLPGAQETEERRKAA